VTSRNFGDIFAGEEIDQVFMVSNLGDAPLELSEKKLTTLIVRRSRRYQTLPAVRRVAPA